MQTVTKKNIKPAGKGVAEPKLDLAQLFQQYYDRIYNYVRYRINSVENSEDLVSLIFEQAYTHRHQFDSTKGTFSTWLFGIARNEVVSYYRRRKSRLAWETDAELPADLVTPELSPESHLIQKEAMIKLLQCLERLSERDQEIISLKFAGRLRNKEIGQVMELKEKTVSVVLLRAVRRLRREMEKGAAS